ncbi:MucBP domain-containing protein [Paenibacillus sp. FSL K6-2524]|uniref:MucBP domain-containing protein n=1 Tax=Paenibacillus sp. FSL K6-2524 TaxID=2954516 RepID=UPI0030FB3EFD
MKRGLKLVVTWLFIVSVFAGFIPGTLPVSSAAASNELIWPNPGAVNLTKTAEPTGTQGQWKVTLTVEGKNIQSTSDVVLVMDRSGSMDGSRMTKAKEAAKKFVDNLLIKDSKTRIAFVSFGEGVTTESDFQGTAGKESLKTKINGISASGGTNIQAGINRARTLLNGSQAQNKVIVLLSDGEPTYSYKAGKATAYNWPDNKFKFALSDFDYSKQLGSGDDYALSEGFFGIGKETYKVNGFDVKNNGIGTISEAKLAKDGGIGIYSIGLEVGDSANAKYVLNNTQNKGYYESSSSELNKVFTELSSKISYAAQNARVIDPMGAKFDKIDGPTVSQGTTSWDSKSETITWEIGNIVEGSPATMSYIVKMDNDADPNVLYPTNKVTTMSYTDVNGKSTSKNFIVPEVSFGKGSITVRGYSVNADGLPINADGVVVEKPELAEQLYNEPFIVNGKPALDINKDYDVTAKAVDGYQLNVGTSPTSVQLTTKAPSPTIWFGYVKAPKVPYTLKVVYKAGDNVLEQSEPIIILQGEAVDYSSKEFVGYLFKNVELSPENSGLTSKDGHVTGKMPNKDVTITFNYEAIAQTVTVKHMEKGTTNVLAPATTQEGKTGETITLKTVDIPGYKADNESYSYTITAEEGQVKTLYYTAIAQTVIVKHVDKATNNVITTTTRTGVTGESITLEPEIISGYTASSENDYSYKFTADADQERTLFYTANTQTVTVKHVDKATNNVITTTTRTGVAGESITLEPEIISGYTASSENDYSYKFTADADQERTLFYTANTQTVTVKHVDKATNNVITTGTRTGVAGESITLEPEIISGYTASSENDYSYKFTADEDQERTLFYTANTQTVTVKHVDKATNNVITTTTRTGVAGESITLEPEITSGYTASSENDYSYKFTADADQERTLLYTKNAPDLKRFVTVNYINLVTNLPLIDPIILEGVVGDILRAEPITVGDAVYTPDESNVDYVITDELKQSTSFYYILKNAVDQQQVLVKYLELGTNAELGNDIVFGKQGATITHIPPSQITVTDAVYTPESPTYSITLTGEPDQEFLIYYSKDGTPVDQYQHVTVKYHLQGTNTQVAEPTKASGIVGSTISLTAISIPGYTAVKSTDTFQVGDNEGQEYIFYYTKNAPVDPNPGTPSNPNTSTPSTTTPLPPAPPVVAPLPPAPPTLEKENHYNYINGYPDGTIKPENRISREEVAAIFYRLMDDETRSSYLKNDSSYGDVEGSRWSNKHIATMENAGIITGYPDGTFKPGRQITRAEFAAIASRFDHLDEQENTLFSDIKDHWAAKYIVSAANKGWIKGYPDGTFKPNQYITRAEAMAFINSVLNRKTRVPGIHEDAKAWPDNNIAKWYYTEVLEATNHHDYSRNEDGSETWTEVKSDRVYP